MRRLQTAGLETLPAIVMRSTGVLKEQSTVLEEGLMEGQRQLRQLFAMSSLVHLLPVSQQPLLLLRNVLEAWWLVALASRVATQP